MDALTLTIIAVFVTFILMTFLLKRTWTGKRVVARRPRQAEIDDADVVIVGAGVLGAAMATVLARDGRRVTVIERETKATETIVGEGLMPGGVKTLTELGLGDVMYGVKDHATHRGVKQIYKGETHLDIPFSAGEAIFFHHHRFVTALRNAAKSEANVSFIEGGSVVELIEEDDIVTGVRYKMHGQGDIEEVRAALTVVSDGRYSKFRKQISPIAPVSEYVCFGFLLNDFHLGDSLFHYYALDLPCYVCLYRISSTETRSFFCMAEPVPKDISKYMQDVVAPQLPEEIREPFRRGVGIQKVRAHYLPPSLIQKPGALVLGDALSMRHPVTAGGMTVALKDLQLWGDILRTIPDLYDYDKMREAGGEFYKQRKKHSFVVSTLAEVFASLYTSTDVHLKELMHGFIKYNALGGKFLEESASMFSALNLSPFVLIKHLLGVVAFTMFLVVKESPLTDLPSAVYRATCILVKAFINTSKVIWAEL